MSQEVTGRPGGVPDVASIASPRPATTGHRRWVVLALQAGVGVALLSAWEAGVRWGLVNPVYVSRPSEILPAITSGFARGPLLDAAILTLAETLAGFGAAIVVGAVVGFALYEWPLAERTLHPYVTALNNLPRLALTPLFVLWLGFGWKSRAMVVFSLAVFVVAISTLAGLRNADRDHLLLAKVLGVGRIRRFVWYILPAALPTMFAGLQLALTYSLMGAIVAEMLVGSDGLGAVLQLSLSTYRTADFFAALAVAAAVAVVLSVLLRLIEYAALAWRRVETAGLEPG